MSQTRICTGELSEGVANACRFNVGLRVTVPDAPILLSGVVGGPAAIFLLTPFRNGLTVGAQDRMSNARQLYGKVFRGGLRGGWVGGGAPAVVACPQFLALGPAYHILNDASRNALNLQAGDSSVLASMMATVGAGLCETFITYGSQARNAQMTYNNSMVQHSSLAEGRRSLALTKPFLPWGVGAAAMTCRNSVSLGSVRTLSPLLAKRMPQNWDSTVRATLADLSAATATCVFSAPLSQVFNFLVTTPESSRLSTREQFAMMQQFLRRQYFVEAPWSNTGLRQESRLRLSPVALRDFGMRSVYVASVFTLFTSSERFFCHIMRP